MKKPLRRFLIASMPNGTIGLGFVGANDSLRSEIIKRRGGPLSLGDCLLIAMAPYEPEEIIALLPGEGVRRDFNADRYVHSTLIGLACPRTSVVHSWQEFRRLQNEQGSDSNINGKHFPTYAHELLMRLHVLQRCMALDDVRLGDDMPFTSEAVAARWDIAVEAAAVEQQRRIAAERELAEARELIGKLEEMNASLRASLLNPSALH